METKTDHEKSDTQNKAPSTPLADAVAKVERVLKENGIELESASSTHNGCGAVEISAVITVN